MNVFNGIQMTRKAMKRVMKRKRQLKKQVKRQQQQEQQQRVMQPMMMGYGHQMYGNADGTMQQLRNQNQTTIDQINSMTSALRSLQNENKKNEAMISELTKKRKDAEHEKDKAKIDLEIAEDKARDVESMMKHREYYIDKQQQLEKEMLEKSGENNRYHQMKELEEQKRRKHEAEMKGIELKQQIEDNKLAAEVKKEMDAIEILATKNQAMFEYIGSDMFKNPQSHLSNAYQEKMKEEDKQRLMGLYKMLDEENVKLLNQIRSGEKVNSDEMVLQLKASIEEKEKIYAINQQENQLLKNNEAAYNHLLKKQEQTINETNDLEIENKRLQYKYTTINKQPETYKETKKQQSKLASAQAKNQVLKQKLDLQKQMKDLQIENSLLEESNNIINGESQYVANNAKDDDDDEVEVIVEEEEEYNENKSKKKNKEEFNFQKQLSDMQILRKKISKSL